MTGPIAATRRRMLTPVLKLPSTSPNWQRSNTAGHADAGRGARDSPHGRGSRAGDGLVDLGLVYEVEVEDSKAKVPYSLTSMGCPAGPLIAQDIDRAVRQVEGIEDVELELTFDPPWTPDRMSDDAKFILGFG